MAQCIVKHHGPPGCVTPASSSCRARQRCWGSHCAETNACLLLSRLGLWLDDDHRTQYQPFGSGLRKQLCRVPCATDICKGMQVFNLTGTDKFSRDACEINGATFGVWELVILWELLSPRTTPATGIALRHSRSSYVSIQSLLLFWDVAPFCLVDTDRSFRGTYGLHHQWNGLIPWYLSQHTMHYSILFYISIDSISL